MKLGLTGGIGCGKSLVGRTLAELGLHHLDTDLVARTVVEPGSHGLARVTGKFGQEVLTPSGDLDRGKLGEIVFKDPAKRNELEKILHPLIWMHVTSFLEETAASGASSVVEVPLLFEKGREGLFDQVWVVATTPEIQKERLALRNGWSKEQAEARIQSQMPIQSKIDLADRVIWNTSDIETLKQSVKSAWNEELGVPKT